MLWLDCAPSPTAHTQQITIFLTVCWNLTSKIMGPEGGGSGNVRAHRKEMGILLKGALYYLAPSSMWEHWSPGSPPPILALTYEIHDTYIVIHFCVSIQSVKFCYSISNGEKPSAFQIQVPARPGSVKDPIPTPELWMPQRFLKWYILSGEVFSHLRCGWILKRPM